MGQIRINDLFISTMQNPSKLLRQFVQYVVVGGVAFLLDLGTLFALTHYMGMHYLLSATAGFLLGLVVNYILCIFWVFTFRAVEKATHEFVIFSVIGIVGLLFNNVLIYGLTEWVELHYLVSKIVAAAVILIFNFSARRALLFSEAGLLRSLNEEVDTTHRLRPRPK